MYLLVLLNRARCNPVTNRRPGHGGEEILRLTRCLCSICTQLLLTIAQQRQVRQNHQSLLPQRYGATTSGAIMRFGSCLANLLRHLSRAVACSLRRCVSRDPKHSERPAIRIPPTTPTHLLRIVPISHHLLCLSVHPFILLPSLLLHRQAACRYFLVSLLRRSGICEHEEQHHRRSRCAARCRRCRHASHEAPEGASGPAIGMSGILLPMPGTCADFAARVLPTSVTICEPSATSTLRRRWEGWPRTSSVTHPSIPTAPTMCQSRTF